MYVVGLEMLHVSYDNMWLAHAGMGDLEMLCYDNTSAN